MCHEFVTTLPGPSQLEITLFDDDVLGKDPMGSTVIDLEDRWFSHEWRDVKKWGGPGKKPIEHRQLYLPTSRTSQGSIRLWVDIMTKEEGMSNNIVDISRPPRVPYELRVVVWYGTTTIPKIAVDFVPGSPHMFSVSSWRPP